jgi:hypothetical protein
MKILSHPIFRKSWLFNTSVVLTVILCLGIAGGIYACYQLEQWLKEQNATIEVKSWKPSFSGLNFPSVVIDKAIIKFKNPQSVIKDAQFNKAVIGINLGLTLRSFLTAGALSVKIEDIKVGFSDQTYMKSATVSGHIIRRWNIYELQDLLIEPFQFGVQQYQEESHHNDLLHLILYCIKGKLNYQIDSQLINLFLEVPQANLQMPEGKSYALQAKGELQVLNQENAKVPVKGEISLQVQSLFNFISHLHSVGVIQGIEKNLAMVLGELLPSKHVTNQKANKEKDVMLKVKFQADGIYIGPLKVYP